MKKTIALLAVIALTVFVGTRTPAAVFILAGSGINIPANSTTNFTNMTLPQIGTFNMTAQSVYTAHNGITNTNFVILSGLLSFDGTNFFKLPQTYVYPTTNPVSGALWTLTNISLPVYGALSVSNGQAQIITNFGGTLQY